MCGVVKLSISSLTAHTAGLVLSDCRHWFSNVACCKQ